MKTRHNHVIYANGIAAKAGWTLLETFRIWGVFLDEILYSVYVYYKVCINLLSAESGFSTFL